MNTRKRTPASAGTADKGKKHLDNVSMDILPHDFRPIQGQSLFIKIPEAMSLLEVSRSTAQRIFRRVNQRLAAAGKFTCQGICNRAAFMAEIGYMGIGTGDKDE